MRDPSHPFRDGQRAPRERICADDVDADGERLIAASGAPYNSEASWSAQRLDVGNSIPRRRCFKKENAEPERRTPNAELFLTYRQKGVIEDVVGDVVALGDGLGFVERPVDAEINPAL